MKRLLEEDYTSDFQLLIDDCKNIIILYLDTKSTYMLYLISNYFNNFLKDKIIYHINNIPWRISIYYLSNGFTKDNYDIDEDYTTGIYDIKLSIGWITDINYFRYDKPTYLLSKNNYIIDVNNMHNMVVIGRGGPIIKEVLKLDKCYTNMKFRRRRNLILPELLFDTTPRGIPYEDDILPYIGNIYNIPDNILCVDSHKNINKISTYNDEYIDNIMIYELI
jgi:hypothetical protein